MFFLEPIFQLINFIFQIIFWGAIIVVGVLVYRTISKTGVIQEEEIIQRWTAFLTNQANAGEELLTLVESELDLRGCPYEISRKTFNLGLSSSNPFVRIKLNFAYSCYVGFEVVGKDLHINWSVREKLGLIYRIPVIGPLLYRFFHVVSFIDRNKLLAFASFTLDCTENAVESFMEKYNIDKTKLAKASSGKLGPL